MAEAKLEASVALMNGSGGFDCVIVCCNTEKMASYWQNRLEAGRGTVVPKSCIVLSVFEDWPGGAGNAFGTLYAWQKACALAITQGHDIAASLTAKNISCALFHTAGKGTRLAPLPGSENNNKPGVKLPATMGSGGETWSILEAVVLQTGIYASSRKGRLSVFWGDQVFVPSVASSYEPKHHADILCTLGPMPSAEVWQAKGLDKYGLIAVSGASGEAAQVDKVDHPTAQRLLASLGEVASVGASLGSFSVSSPLLSLFMSEFNAELSAKAGKLDTDPGLWMPMTLGLEAYVDMMGPKGMEASEATAHHARIAAMKKRLPEFEEKAAAEAEAAAKAAEGSSPAPGSSKSFKKSSSSGGESGKLLLFGAVDVGEKAYWWDYGQLKLYRTNNLKLVREDGDHESATMRSFFSMHPSRVSGNSVLAPSVLSGGSTASGCKLGPRSAVVGSVLANVTCPEVSCEGAILVNVTACKIAVAPGCVVYNVASTDPEGIVLTEPNSVLTTALLHAESSPPVGEAGEAAEAGAAASAVVVGGSVREVTMRSSMDTDGGKAWKAAVLGNPFSFEQVYEFNGDADVCAMEAASKAIHAAAAAKFSL